MIVSRTPFRISFFGGGTDYPEYFEHHGPGAVLATAIDKSLFISMTRFNSALFDYKIRLAYSKVECVPSVEQIEHGPFRQILQYHGIDAGAEFSLHADLPSFSGTGSSSSFVVGLLKTLWTEMGGSHSTQDLAKQSIRIERDILKESVGCQDQILAAYGGFNVVQFEKGMSFAVYPLNLTAERIRELEAH